MRSQAKNNIVEETPHDMMKRIFAVAELIVQSDGYSRDKTMRSAYAEKHKSGNSLYCKNHTDGLGNTNGAEET